MRYINSRFTYLLITRN